MKRMCGGLVSRTASLSQRIVSFTTTTASPVLSEQSVEVHDDRPFAAACADEAQEPVDESREPVLKPRHESDVHDEPHEPRDPAGEPHPVQAEDGAAAIHGGHAPEVPVLPRLWFCAASHTISNDVSSMQAGLEGNLRNAREVVVIHHVADYEHLRVTGQ